MGKDIKMCMGWCNAVDILLIFHSQDLVFPTMSELEELGQGGKEFMKNLARIFKEAMVKVQHIYGFLDESYQ